ncbi:MAG: NUDIX domain-containing protein [Hyphomicrobiales bacterium]
MSNVKLPDNFSRQVPPGDDLERDVCNTCGFISYANPKIVTGSVVTAPDGKVLLCRRAIDPRDGYWTLPAGYMELNETPAQGAAREAMEEANARIEISSLLAVYSITRLSQVQLIYRAILVDPNIAPGLESREVGLFDWNEIPWNDLAFPSVHWALNHYKEIEGLAEFTPFTNPPGESGNSLPHGI